MENDNINNEEVTNNLNQDSNQILSESKVYYLAGNFKRWFNYIIDIVFIIIFYFIVLLIVILFFDLNETFLDNPFVDFLIYPFMFFYFVILEYYFGKTIGKFFTKTKVLNLDNEKPNLDALIKRTLCRFIPFEAFTFLSSNTYGLHDRLSKTKVVED